MSLCIFLEELELLLLLVLGLLHGVPGMCVCMLKYKFFYVKKSKLENICF